MSRYRETAGFAVLIAAGVGMVVAITAATHAAADAPPTPAPAVATTDVAIDGTTLRITAHGEVSNSLYVRGNGVGFDIYDRYSVLVTGSGADCLQLAVHHVTCETRYRGAEIAGIEIDGGEGNDYLALDNVRVPVTSDGGAGDDLVQGGESHDHLQGGPGVDAVYGGSGVDTMGGGEGDDLLRGDTGGDTVSGGDGADILEGGVGASADVLAGGAGPDLLRGGPGDDNLDGGSGADVIATGTGTDTAVTGTGADRVIATTGDGVKCGAPTDRVSVIGGGPTPPGCTPAAPTKVPDVWPPPPEPTQDPTDLRAGPADLKGTYKVTRKDVFNPGQANTIAVTIFSSLGATNVCLKVSTLPKGRGARIATFRKWVNTKHAAKLRPKKPKGVHKVNASVLRNVSQNACR